MIAFGFAIFLSAFLLFTVQPLLAKKLLPWFGGSPTVWLANMLFFQAILLAGYLYAFCLTKLPNSRWQVFIHFLLLGASFLFVPLSAHAIELSTWLPLKIIFVLAQTFFLPGLLISASSPLLQYWFYRCYHAPFPYRYYALSNLGSLLGLLAYPFIIEPLLGLTKQMQLWSLFYGLFVLGVIGCLMVTLKRTQSTRLVPEFSARESDSSSSATQTALTYRRLFLWVLLTFLSNALLLSSTQFMLQNIVGFPLLWVLPLALYLITFIITFAHPKWYWRSFWLMIFGACIVFILSLISHHQLALWVQILVFSLLLFSGCMICHGELILLKPHPSRLTAFYLAIAFGGVLGGIFISLLAPLLLNSWVDFYGVLAAIFLVGTVAFHLYSQHRFDKLIWPLMGLIICLFAFFQENDHPGTIILKERNFFGMLEVLETFSANGQLEQRQLRNGSILHGLQFMHGPRRFEPSSYYSTGSGLSWAFEFERLLKFEQPYYKGLKVGVIGLGIGTISAMGQKGDLIRFYEIDPDVVKIAWQQFYYLKETKALVDIIVDDGRLALAKNPISENYDILVVDAFSGDAIPLHLLTLEAMQTYLFHLAPQGILVFHISSRYIDLYPPLQALASYLGWYAYDCHNSADFKNWVSSSEWVLITRAPGLGMFLYDNHAILFRTERTGNIWTDDYHFIFSQIKW